MLAQLQSLALTLLPSGGQRTARRNAWAAMAADARHARARREAAEALAVTGAAGAVGRDRDAPARVLR